MANIYTIQRLSYEEKIKILEERIKVVEQENGCLKSSNKKLAKQLRIANLKMSAYRCLYRKLSTRILKLWRGGLKSSHGYSVTIHLDDDCHFPANMPDAFFPELA